MVNNISYLQLNKTNFDIRSLDGFERYQQVNKCWRKVDNRYVLTSVEYTEDRADFQLRQMANKILSSLSSGAVAYAAIFNGKAVGFALVEAELFGSKNQYAALSEFYVSRPFRRQGIGKRLFALACDAARNFGAAKIYISAHSAEESIAAYKYYGCVFAKEINRDLAEKEPFDLQLEFDLNLKL